MKTACLFILSFALLESTLAQFGGGYYGGGFFGGGYGCPSYLPTNGFQCYQPKQDNTVWCKGTGSSTYQNAGYFGDYRAFLAVDGQLSPGNSGFYHSNLETYPWLKIDIRKPDDSDYEPQTINRVQIYQRCDANEIYHQTNFEVRANDGNPGTVYGSPRLVGGKFCGTYRAWFPTGGTSFTVPCPTPIASAKEVWIQKTTLHSHGGGWPNYGGGQWNSYTGNAPAQNSNWPVAFLMINEVVLY